MSERRFLVGTYTTQRASRGLYLCAMDTAGRIDVLDVCALPDPSFVVLHPRLPLAYAVNETPDDPGGVSVIAIDGDRLFARERVSSGGHLPCHLALLADASALAVAHYGCGTVGVFALDDRGRLDGDRYSRRHEGASVHTRRQVSAHPHCVVVGAGGVYVTDLGQDCIVHYTGAPLVETSRCRIHRGAGPRHLYLDERRRIGWLSNELDNTVSRLRVAPDGSLHELDWVSTLPDGFAGRSAVSEIACHPNGRWLYVGNRGEDSLVWFEIDAEGKLSARGSVATQGRHPRHFALTLDGAALLVANRDSDSLVPFAVDSARGQPQPLAEPFTGIPAPVCVRWL